jgi:anti-sigma factor RsiW
MNQHLGDDAELYALGALEPAERDAVDAHLTVCAECAQRVGAAEETVAHLASVVPRAEPSPELGARIRASAAMRRSDKHLPREQAGRALRLVWMAVAASLVLAVALGAALVQSGVLKDQLRADDLALVHVVYGHFQHAPLTRRVPSALAAAKVLYASDGSWLYVVADRPTVDLHLFERVQGVDRDVGTLARRGSLATLFVRAAGRPGWISLRDGSGIVASAQLSYAQ